MPYHVRLEQLGSRPLAVFRRRARSQELAKVVPDACGTVWGVSVRNRSQAQVGTSRCTWTGRSILKSVSS